MENNLKTIKKFLSLGENLTYYLNSKECFASDRITNFSYKVSNDKIDFFKENEPEIYSLTINLKMVESTSNFSEQFISIKFKTGLELIIEIQ